MIKIEADVIYPDGSVSYKVMWVLSCCIGMLRTLSTIIVLLIILRKVLILQLEMDQRKVYIRKDER